MFQNATKLQQWKRALHTVREKFARVVSRFSKTQVKIMTRDLTKSWWSEQDICKALCLRAKSLRAYEFVRERFRIPLPCLRTLQMWMRQISFDPGLLKSVMNLMKCEFEYGDILRRQCVIIFDEMNIEANIAYDPGSDRIYGPHKNLLVVFLRGLFSPWKQPIYYGYDEKLDPEKIFDIISKVQDTGMNVVAMTCDNAGGNRGIWTKLDVNHKNTHFKNPVTGKPVFYISDPPHLIKLMRNNLMDYGFELSDGCKIQKKDFEDLLKVDRNELKSVHKLTQRHINAIKTDRQNVLMAFQTISASVAEGFKTYLFNRKRQAEFIKLANDAFDTLNSRDENHLNPIKCSFGTHLNMQILVLEKFYHEVDNMKVMSPRPMKHYPFQKGILMTINSTKELFQSMKDEFGIRYINMNRLNQDVAENAFGIMRGLGGFKQNPNCVDAKYRLRMLSVGWHLLAPSKYAQVGEDADKMVFAKGIKPLMQTSPVPVSPISNEVEEALQDIQELDADLSENNFLQFYESLSMGDKAEFGGQEYISGYIIRKFKLRFPDLALEENPSNGLRESWTRRLSLGKLTVPSLDFLNLIRKWEKYFQVFHGEDPTATWRYKLNRNFGVMKLLKERIQLDFPDVPPALIQYFVKVRTCIRIKDLNIKMNQWRASKRNSRKASQFAQSLCPNEALSENENTDDEA